MLFASDLDQTLIYSPKSFRLPTAATQLPVRAVEMYEGRAISFMTVSALTKLQSLASQLSFVPVTTRTLAQYRRISLFSDIIRPKYSVVSNGGTILVDAVVDVAWQANVKAAVVQCCMAAADILARFDELQHEAWAAPLKMADDLFYYCVVERNHVPLAELADFTAWATRQNWQVSLQGRKLYLVPRVVNKWAAIAHIRDRLQQTKVLAAGDSLLDLCMLEQADHAISPCHGELWDSQAYADKLKFTAQAGILAAQDILDYAATWL